MKLFYLNPMIERLSKEGDGSYIKMSKDVYCKKQYLMMS